MSRHRTPWLPSPHLRLFFVAAGLSLSFAGCSSPPLTLEKACSDYTYAFRNEETNCDGVAPAPNQSTLISRQIEECVLFAGAPGSQVDPSYFEDCATSVPTGCVSFSCGTYPAGARVAGQPCLDATQCASLWCSGTGVTGAPDAIQCGTCAPLLAAGTSCDVVTDACDVGLSCFKGACRTQGLQGASCAVWADCAFPWVCKSNGTCDSVNADGAACVNRDDCASDTACDLTSKLCTPVQFGQPGSACDGATHSCEAGLCAGGVCPAILADGAACDPTDASKVCDDYARCFGGVCQIPDPASCK